MGISGEDRGATFSGPSERVRLCPKKEYKERAHSQALGAGGWWCLVLQPGLAVGTPWEQQHC